MNTIREFSFLLRQWWKLYTGPMEQRRLADLNEDITDPEWWKRRSALSYVHPLRCHSYAPKMQAASEVVDTDETLSQRRDSIVRQWDLVRHFRA
jgi:hypothetical protein